MISDIIETRFEDLHVDDTAPTKYQGVTISWDNCINDVTAIELS